MIIVIALFILRVCSCTTVTQTHYHSCAAIYKSDILSTSGVYTVYNRLDQPFQVYCDFYKGYGYTYISPNTTVVIDIDDLYTNSTHVLVRDLRKDGGKFEAKIEQITAFHTTPLSIQYNRHTGYASPQNYRMTPMVYVGFLPTSQSHSGQKEGYKLNGVDQTCVNCNGNPNNYFAFLFNHNHISPSPYSYNPTNSIMQHNWTDGAHQVSQDKKLPNSFFSFFEMHFGGCGAYGTPQRIQQVSGAALGLRYDITCKAPEDISNSIHFPPVPETKFGSTVTYLCYPGYDRMSGNLTRTCTETGRWSGVAPSCAVLPCYINPCKYGATCTGILGGQFVCVCPVGFEGQRCEIIMS